MQPSRAHRAAMAKSDLLLISDADLQTLGEIVGLHGYIAIHLEALGGFMALLAKKSAARTVKHGSMHEDVRHWAKAARELMAGDAEVLAIVADVERRLGPNLKDRSDFVHAVFAAQRPDGVREVGTAELGGNAPVVAQRLGRQQVSRATEDLEAIRAEADAIAHQLRRLHELLTKRMP